MSDSQATLKESLLFLRGIEFLRRHVLVMQGVVMAAYAGMIVLGQHLCPIFQDLPLVRFASAVGLVAVLLFDMKAWPALAVGSAAVSVLTGHSFLLAAAVAAGELLEAVLGAYILRNAVRFRLDLGRVRDVLGLLVFGSAIAAMAGATVGSLSYAVDGLVPWADIGRTWRIWWLGDAAGVLIGGPLLLSWAVRSEQQPAGGQMVESAALVLTLLPALLLIYGSWLPTDYSESLSFLAFPFVIWGALRFGQRGTTVVIALTMILAIQGTMHGGGPFADQRFNVTMVFFYGYMATVATTGLLLGAATTERRRSAEELHRIGLDLEIRVNERTAALQEELTRRRRIQEDLQEAMNSVKTLSGLLPICSSCKRIRDDRGYWTQVERYLTEHTQAQFSHGLCPECFKTLYPEYLERPTGGSHD